MSGLNAKSTEQMKRIHTYVSAITSHLQNEMVPQIYSDTYTNAYSDSIPIAKSVSDMFSRVTLNVPKSTLMGSCTARRVGIHVRVEAHTR